MFLKILSQEESIAIAAVIAFAITFVTTALLIRKLKKHGVVGVDLNKISSPLPIDRLKQLKTEGSHSLPTVPRGGGIAIVFGFMAASLFSLLLIQAENVVYFLAALLSISLIATIGILEDFLQIRQLYRTILPAFAALPLMAVLAGNHSMILPFFGLVDFGLFYPLFLIPIGVVACSNLVNLLAGFNGLEAGIGAIISLTLFIASISLGEQAPAFLSISLFAACIAFLFYNWFPAKVFPGNSATYIIGSAIAAIVIIGNFERVGVICLFPQIIEFFLKARSGFLAENYGRLNANGRLEYHGRPYSISHFIMQKFKPSEPKLVLMLLSLQALFALLAIASIQL